MNLKTMGLTELRELRGAVSDELQFRQLNPGKIPIALLEELKTEVQEIVALAKTPFSKTLSITATVPFTVKHHGGDIDLEMPDDPPADLIASLKDNQRQIELTSAIMDENITGKDLIAFPDMMEHLGKIREKHKALMSKVEKAAIMYETTAEDILDKVDPGHEWH